MNTSHASANPINVPVIGEERSNSDRLPSRTKKSFLDEIRNLRFSDDVCSKADEIYSSMRKRPNRKLKRRQLIFFCLYQAHRELKITIAPNLIADVVGISRGEAIQTGSLFSPLQTGYEPVRVLTTAQDLLPSYCNAIGFEEATTEEAVRRLSSLLEKDTRLKRLAPQTVAAGFLRYYMMVTGLLCEPNKLEQITNRSEATIDQVCKTISMLDNA